MLSSRVAACGAPSGLSLLPVPLALILPRPLLVHGEPPRRAHCRGQRVGLVILAPKQDYAILDSGVGEWVPT